VKRLEEKKQGDLEVFKWFRTHVIDSKLEPSIEHHELVSVSNINPLLFLNSFLICFIFSSYQTPF
jgi:hypothetical protein